MHNLEAREIFILDVEDVQVYDGENPSSVVLKIKRRTFDIGSYCFAERDIKAGSRSQFKRVVKNTYSEVRARCVSALISYSLQLRHFRGLSPDTVAGRWVYIKAFLDWCDSQSRFADLTITSERRGCVKEYCSYLNLQCRLDDNATNKYAIAQRTIIEIVSIAFSDECVGHGIFTLKTSNAYGIPVETPGDEEQAKSYAMCKAVYTGFSKFFSNFESYPFRWELPPYLGGKVWVFPCITKFRSPFSNITDSFVRTVLAIDFDNGCIRSLEALEGLYSNKSTARTCRDLLLGQIVKANNDPRAFHRIVLANHAMHAFAAMFQSKTTMNYKQLCELSWGNSYTLEKSDPHFKVIKWRAGGVEKFFRVSTDFIAEFKCFLEFREKLLNGAECSYLFFTVHQGDKFCELDLGTFHRMEKFMLRVDQNFRLVRTRQWRAAKSNSHLKNFNINVASNALQSDRQTIFGHYSQGSEVDQRKQFSEFFKRLLIVVARLAKKFTQIGVAMCQKPGVPQPESNAPVTPDCKGDFGCLFCGNFRVYVDEKSVRKLLSCRYFIERISYVNPTDLSQDIWYKPVIERLDGIIEHIRGVSSETAEMVSKIEKSVNEEHQLDPYWEGRIEVLIQVGVLV
ncbi:MULTISPECIES: hypothetical protein [Pseudomonas]|uniref:hypothetical protein n=1 Tax=Pseudomonas TaxID=286 RepID=UPI00137942A0|nr:MULTISPECIES: hypothetical protein [Pseudomonas]